MKVMVIGVSLALVAAAADGPKKVSGTEQEKKLVNKVAPTYPPEAKEKGLGGTVKLQAIIAKDGTVKELTVLSGDQIFIPNTLEAVKQWTYEPTNLNGKPIEVITDIQVNYVLSK